MENLYRELKQEVAKAELHGRRIVFVDECLFSSKAMLKTAYSNKKENVKVAQKLIASKPIALVAAVSKEFGLDAFLTYEKSLDSLRFSHFLDTLKEKTNGEPYPSSWIT